MSSSRLMLEDKSGSDEVTKLRREIVGLEFELQQARGEAAQAKQAAADSIHAIRALRKVLEPFRVAIGMIYGEISRVEVEAATESESPSSGSGKGVWQERIAKSGTQHARILQVMLDGGGEMSYGQIKSAARTGGNTSARLSELIAKNWVQKSGHGQYSLK